MQPVSWLLLSGLVLLVISLVDSLLKKAPVSTAALYLITGFVVAKLGLHSLDPLQAGRFFEHATELVIIVSIFASALKLRLPLRLSRWSTQLRLAFGTMALTVFGVAVAGIYGLGLSVGAAIILGAALSPTDPVLASDTQVESAKDTDKLRRGLTGEAAMNDGAAWPAALLGLALLAREPGSGAGWFWKWAAVDLAWAIFGGLTLGFALGTGFGKLILFLRTRHREGVGRDDFLALGLIALSYAIAVKTHASGFLAVFAAAVALRRMELRGAQPAANDVRAAAQEEEAGEEAGEEELSHKDATHPEKAHAFMAEAVLSFTEKIERLAEAFLILLTGILLASVEFTPALLWLTPLLFFVIRPIATTVVLMGTGTSRVQRALMAWFGVRGVASLYYLFFAMQHGLANDVSQTLVNLVVPVVAASVLLHGISVTPLMSWYRKRRHPAEHGEEKQPGRRPAEAT